MILLNEFWERQLSSINFAESVEVQALPQLKRLRGVPQNPLHHPEGTAFIHTMHTIRAMEEVCNIVQIGGDYRKAFLLVMLFHDMGKAECTELHPTRGWISENHAQISEEIASAILDKWLCRSCWKQWICNLVRYHMRHISPPTTSRGTRRLARRLFPATIRDLYMVANADVMGRPPLPATLSPDFFSMVQRAIRLGVFHKDPSP